MSTSDVVTFNEASSKENFRSVRLSHLSIEVGHFYMEDLAEGEAAIRSQFERLVPWVTAARATVKAKSRPRISTCFLMDDYFCHDTDPAEVVGKLTRAASDCGIPIDYIVREASCCVAEGIPLAEMTAARLLPEPLPGTNGSRPPSHESGWICNGERSPGGETDQAMHVDQWQPPKELAKRNHSIFTDVEMWRDSTERVDGQLVTQRTWSCPFLATVWHLLRLGMLRYYGESVVRPRPAPGPGDWPDSWDDLPSVICLNPEAEAFSAYRSVSIMPGTYQPIEAAIRVILGHLSLDERETEDVVRRGAGEGLALSRDVLDRMSHVFTEA